MKNMFNTDIEFECGYDIEETPVGEVERYCSRILTEYVLSRKLVDKDDLTREEKDLKFDLECEFEDAVLDYLRKYGDWTDIYRSLIDSIIDATCILINKYCCKEINAEYYTNDDCDYGCDDSYYILINGLRFE